jgi:hypothetical protein
MTVIEVVLDMKRNETEEILEDSPKFRPCLGSRVFASHAEYVEQDARHGRV